MPGGNSGAVAIDCTSLAVDESHLAYILGARASLVIPDASACSPRASFIVALASAPPVSIPTTGAYVAELCFDVSVDASGTFTSDWINPGIETKILDDTGLQAIPNAVYDGLVINVVPCTAEADCYDGNVCTQDQCIAGTCRNSLSKYGDVDHNGVINIFDLLCILAGFGGNFSTCSFVDDDIAPCEPNDTIDIFDLLAVLVAFSGGDPCCDGLP